jgi:hypothetical protein
VSRRRSVCAAAQTLEQHRARWDRLSIFDRRIEVRRGVMQLGFECVRERIERALVQKIDFVIPSRRFRAAGEESQRSGRLRSLAFARDDNLKRVPFTSALRR